MITQSASRGVTGNAVGPVFRTSDLAQAAVEAVEEDNPGKDVTIEDNVAYIRVHCANECVITRKTMQRILGRPFRMQEIEACLASFAGQIEFDENRIRFFFAKQI